LPMISASAMEDPPHSSGQASALTQNTTSQLC
jgi:hypothetical protein